MSAGPAFPMGDFASKDISTNTQAGMGMKLLFGKSMFAQLGLDYLAMSPEFTIEGDAIEDPTGTKYTQPISTLNLYFGIGIHF